MHTHMNMHYFIKHNRLIEFYCERAILTTHNDIQTYFFHVYATLRRTINWLCQVGLCKITLHLDGLQVFMGGEMNPSSFRQSQLYVKRDIFCTYH